MGRHDESAPIFGLGVLPIEKVPAFLLCFSFVLESLKVFVT